MLAVPLSTPVTTPVEDPIVAIEVLPLFHVPPDGVVVSVVVSPAQTVAVPEIAAGV
jgi:hypothetical protein